MTSPRPWYSHYIADYDQDTVDLTLLQHGAYRRLMDHYYRLGGPLPANASVLHRVCSASTKAEREAVNYCLSRFFAVTNGFFVQRRIERELKKMADISQKRAKAAMQMHSKSSAKAPANAHTLHTSHFTEDKNLSATHSSDEGSDPPKETTKVNGKSNGHDVARVDAFPTAEHLQMAADHWNEIAAESGLPQIEKLTDGRKRVLGARLRECGDVGSWMGVINMVMDSPFLLGRVAPRAGSEQPFRASFDWANKAENFQRIKEGRYT